MSTKSHKLYVQRFIARIISAALLLGMLQVVALVVVPTISNAAVYTCAQGGPCAVGQVGPGGGRVFYAPGTNFTMTGAPCGSVCRYLESAPITGAYAFDNVTRYGLLGSNLHASAPTSTSIGSGFSNTTTLASISALPTAAANIAKGYRGSANLTDWFLPSELEIAEYWKSKPTDATSYYIASNRNGTAIAIVSKGGPYYDYNTGKRPVIPIRAFGVSPAPTISISQSEINVTVGRALTSYAISSIEYISSSLLSLLTIILFKT